MLRCPRFLTRTVLGVVSVLSIAMVYVAIWPRRDSTIYAPGYSWTKFSSIRNGMTPAEVTRILGQPLSIEPLGGEIHWIYHNPQNMPKPFNLVDEPINFPASVNANFVADLSGKIIMAHNTGESPEAEEMVGKRIDDVRARYGPPPTVYTIPRQTIYWYSKLRNVKGEYVMAIHFNESGNVYQIDANRLGHYIASPGVWPRPSSFLEWLEWYVL